MLSDAQIDRIAKLAETAERLFSGPQDIEGVVTADSAIHLVQVRPAVRPRTVSPSVEWTNHNLTESFPGVTTAMTYSHARTFYRMSFRDFYRTVGVPESQLHSREHQLRRMVGYLDGRLYYRLDAWYALHSQIPGWDVLRPMWERSLGLEAHNPVPRLALDRRAVAGLLARSPRLIWAAVRFPRQLRSFLAWWDDQHMAGMELSQLPAEEIVAVYRRVWSEAERHWGVTILAGYLGLAVYAAATLLVQRWTEIAEVNLAALLPGGTPNRTLESVHSTVALAEQINAIPGLSQRVLTADAGETWDHIERGGYGSKLAADAITHLRKFGDRAMNDLKIEEPTPRQRPEMLIESLRPFVAAGTTMQQTSVQESTAARGALDELRRICPSRWRRAILHVALRAGRFLAKAREDTRFCRTQLYGFSREVMSRLGSDLAAAGWLDSPDDYVHLEAEELLGAFDGTSTHVDLRHLARARKDAYLQSCRRPALAPRFTTAALPIEVADLRRSAANAPAAGGCSTVLAGLPSSAGIARGQAKLVLRPDVRPDDCAGRILVARETDPGWLPLMLNASGLGRRAWQHALPHRDNRPHARGPNRSGGVRGDRPQYPTATISKSTAGPAPFASSTGTDRNRGDIMRLPLDPRPGTSLPPEYVDLFRGQPTLDVELPDGTAAIAVARQCDVRTVLSDNRFSRAQFRHAHAMGGRRFAISRWSPAIRRCTLFDAAPSRGGLRREGRNKPARPSNMSPTNSSTTCSRQARPPTSTRGSAIRSRTSSI